MDVPLLQLLLMEVQDEGQVVVQVILRERTKTRTSKDLLHPLPSRWKDLPSSERQQRCHASPHLVAVHEAQPVPVFKLHVLGHVLLLLVLPSSLSVGVKL